MASIARWGAPSTLAGAAALWPSAYCALTSALATPYERILAASACGAAPRAAFEVLGHCPTCWAGMGMLGLAAVAAAWAKHTPLTLRIR